MDSIVVIHTCAECGVDLEELELTIPATPRSVIADLAKHGWEIDTCPACIRAKEGPDQDHPPRPCSY